jgi:hypothetical protein
VRGLAPDGLAAWKQVIEREAARRGRKVKAEVPISYKRTRTTRWAPMATAMEEAVDSGLHAEVEADLVQMLGPETAARTMEAARENAKMTDEDIKAAVTGMWDEVPHPARRRPARHA